MEQLLQTIIIGLVTGGLYALIGLGFVLIYKASGTLNIAQGQFVLLGAYIGYTLSGPVGLDWWIALPVTLAAVALVGALVEPLVLRPLSGQSPLTLILATLGVASCLDGIMTLFWGSEVRVFAQPIFPRDNINLLGTAVGKDQLYTLLMVALLAGGFSLFFKYSRIGLKMRAVSEDSQIAQSLSIKLSSVYRTAWMLAAGIAALGGVVFGSITAVDYMLVEIGLRSLAVVLLGGTESLLGVFIAGPMIGLIEIFGSSYVDPLVGGGMRSISAWVAMIVVLFFRPFGLFGLKKIERV